MNRILISLIVGLFVLRLAESQQTQTQPAQVQQPQVQQPQIQQPVQTQAAIPMTCYQQITAPSGFNNISFPTNNQNQYQQPQQAIVNASFTSISCSATTTACFKFLCAGVSNYTAKGCQDPALTQFSCQTLMNQCPGAQGQCFTCAGNNCNGASEMKVGSMTLIGFLMLSVVFFFESNQK